MIRYTVYLPSYTHDALPIGTIEHHPASNQAVLRLDGSKEKTFYSVAAAMHSVKQQYPNAFLEDGE